MPCVAFTIEVGSPWVLQECEVDLKYIENIKDFWSYEMPGKRFELLDIIFIMYMFFSKSFRLSGVVTIEFSNSRSFGGGTFVSPKSPEMMEKFVALKSGWNDGMFQRCLGNQEIIFFQEL